MHCYMYIHYDILILINMDLFQYAIECSALNSEKYNSKLLLVYHN